MTSAAQPNPIEGLTADAALAGAARESDVEPTFAGDMPDDPEEAVHYRPGEDGPGGRMDTPTEVGDR